MNQYTEMKDRHQREVDAFPLAFAFSDSQFAEGMQKLGLDPTDTNKVYSIGGGGFMRRTDSDAFKAMFDRHSAEMAEAIASDPTGEGFIFDMFNYELANHEYIITYCFDDTLRALGITFEEVEADERLTHGLLSARKAQLEEADR